MIEVRPFRPFHIALLRAQGVQGAQERAVSHVPENIDSLGLTAGPAVTAFDGELVLLTGGVLPFGQRRGVCWALLSAHAGRHMTRLHYATERFLSAGNWRRLEATVEEGFKPGCRWLQLLGFEFEGRMRGYGDDGETHLRYGRVF